MCTPVPARIITDAPFPPKLSLEKGMGMTPGYNHRLRLRNTLLDPVLSRRRVKNSPDLRSLLYGGNIPLTAQDELLIYFFFLPQVAFFKFSVWGKIRLCVFMSLSV